MVVIGIATMILATVTGVAAGLVVLGFSVTRHCAGLAVVVAGATGLGRLGAVTVKVAFAVAVLPAWSLAVAVAVSVPMPLVPPLSETAQGASRPDRASVALQLAVGAAPW